MKPAHLTEYDLLKLDWIQILKDTIDMRPTSWWLPEHSQYPVKEWKNAKNLLKRMIRTIDLFAGIGGVRIGFENTGFFRTVFANDFDISCKVTYDLNFNDAKLTVGDITKININDLPEFDFLLGGFPCQAFSIAGYQEGFDDKKGRGNLFFDVAKIIKERQQMGFLLENVKNLEKHDGGKTLRIIKDTLKALGYHVKHKVLNSMDYGNVPQTRERIYIVGFKNKIHYDNFEFPKKQLLNIKIGSLLEMSVPEKYYYSNKALYPKLKDQIVRTDTIYQWRRVYVRENKNKVCPTLTANMGMGGHNVPIINDWKGIRKLTPRECLRFQGYKDTYRLPKNLPDSQLYKQIGNSVTVPVIEAIANQIIRAISVQKSSVSINQNIQFTPKRNEVFDYAKSR